MTSARLSGSFKPYPSRAELPPYKTSILRPIVNIRLRHGGKTTAQIDALVDCGCAITMSEGAFAAQLGIDRTGCKRYPVGGIGPASVFATLNKVTMNVSGYEYETDVLFADRLPVPGLLGLHGFFDRFDCRISQGNQTVELCFNHDRRKVALLGGQPHGPDILFA